MILNKKFSYLIISLMLALTQVGCIVGFIFPPLSIGSITLLACGNHGTLMRVLTPRIRVDADAFNEIPMEVDLCERPRMLK